MSGRAGIALVRRPGPRLAEGLVTHIDRAPVDVGLAHRQHDAYRGTLAAAGWTVREVEPADDCPDAVFVEDTLVVCDDVAVVTRPGAPERRGETAGAERAAAALGLTLARIEPPATLEGGDVLQVGSVVYVGRSGRTNAEGVRQLRALLTPMGRTVVPVRLDSVLHLKSAATALPDGTVLALPGHVDTAQFRALRPVREDAGSHVVPLGGDDLLISAAAPRTAAGLEHLGFRPHVVDITEFEKLEGCVTCLNVLVPT